MATHCTFCADYVTKLSVSFREKGAKSDSNDATGLITLFLLFSELSDLWWLAAYVKLMQLELYPSWIW